MLLNNQYKNYKNTWSFVLHVQHPYLYSPVLEDQKIRAKKEVNGICKLFKKYDIPPRTKILDFSCGIGRHSILFAKKNYNVIGYDPSKFYLDIARKNSEKIFTNSKKRPKFYEGYPTQVSNILKKHKEDDFDVILILDNCLGYVDESYDISILTELKELSKKNCLLIIETENRDLRLANFEPITYFNSKKVEIYSSWKFNYETSISEGVSKFYVKNDTKDKTLELRLKLDMPMRLYSLHEIINLLNRSGWKYLENYNDIISLSSLVNDKLSIFTISKLN